MDKIVGIDDVKKVALALKDLKVNFAFVGGAIVSLYVNDKGADASRETTDVDLSVSVKGYASWASLQDQLSQLGFSPDPDSKVICRYLYRGITVDIMPDDEKILGFSNPWYKPGLARIEVHKLDDSLEINLFPIPYFLATKFTAIRGRGKGDHRTSHDFEDVIYVTDNVTDIVDIIEKADKEVKAFLVSEYAAIKDHSYRREIISAHLSRLIRDSRYPLIVDRIERIAALSI